MHSPKRFRILFLSAVLLLLNFSIHAQIDTTKTLSIDIFILRQKGIIGKLAKNLLTDTIVEDLQVLLRADKPFQRYKGRIIRNIEIQSPEFGVSVTDTTKRIKNRLRRISNMLHRQTREFVIRNNLFFSEEEKLSPFVLVDNERHLRDLPFFRDAKIRVVPVRGSTDSVDIIVITRDVLSLGGSFRLHSSVSVSIGLKDDNFLGYGDRIRGETLFDINRTEKFGYGFEYIKRNILGSFVDGAAGFTNFNKSFSNGKREEQVTYFRLARPQVNRYMKWTYGSELEWRQTQNFYNTDSLYQYDYKYKYDIIDTWGALNIDATKVDVNNEKARWRRLIGLRVLKQDFIDKPLKYADQYNYSYADLKAMLGSFSFFRQNFYKTQYIYGFGRNEDVPEGMEAAFTTGFTIKDGRERPFAGVNFQRYYFTTMQHYFKYTISAGTYLYKGKMEDIDLLARVEYFSRLHHLNRKWKQRFFFNTSITKQINTLLNEPLKLESEFGLQELKNNNLGGDFRFTVKGESVFFSPWSVLFFRFAPFVFANAAYLNLIIENESVPRLYSALGGGVRIRNESLIFGTIEFRGMYFPRKNYNNESWRVQVKTDLRFKYNQEIIRRPEFVKVN